ncbi:MAG: VOC family protein [Pseudohongiellaceae bacterium]
MKISLMSIPVQDPILAHEIYTSKLGFTTKEFDPATSLAIVVAPEDTSGTSILLEPCQGSFYEQFQKSAFDSNLPLTVLGANNVEKEIERLKQAGVKLRPDLDKPEWGLQNMFEDGCGNLLMIEETADK